MPTISKEDYIKAIYQLESYPDKSVSTTDVANKLEVSKAATSEMVQRLSEQGFLNYEKYRGMSLTEDGKRTALHVIRRHRIWELFLVDVLGLTWSEVHAEAEILEHSTSDFLIERLDKYLRHPKFDPHGEPIPDKYGNLPELPDWVSLPKCEVGKSYRLVKVTDSSKELMDYFTEIGLSLNKVVMIVSRLSYDNSTIIQVGNDSFNISEKIASNLFFIEDV
ncbi:MAG: metal-dependent transcriptional regulator [Ignavibacteriales bacterium]|nr:metal-dependent transcriptional regulator [Ignavibacteriales bacterium]